MTELERVVHADRNCPTLTRSEPESVVRAEAWQWKLFPHCQRCC